LPRGHLTRANVAHQVDRGLVAEVVSIHGASECSPADIRASGTQPPDRFKRPGAPTARR
jgi:hypothetical protein